MDSSDSMSSSSMTDSTMTMGTMTPWLHFRNSDPILFHAWRPTSTGAVAGACIALILFSILERGFAAYRRTREVRWKAKLILTSSSIQSIVDKEGNSVSPQVPLVSARQAPFTPARDMLRGILQAVESTFSYALMLVVMSFNGAYIISIILGLGLGEVLFGRIARGLDNI